MPWFSFVCFDSYWKWAFFPSVFIHRGACSPRSGCKPAIGDGEDRQYCEEGEHRGRWDPREREAGPLILRMECEGRGAQGMGARVLQWLPYICYSAVKSLQPLPPDQWERWGSWGFSSFSKVRSCTVVSTELWTCGGKCCSEPCNPCRVVMALCCPDWA